MVQLYMESDDACLWYAVLLCALKSADILFRIWRSFALDAPYRKLSRILSMSSLKRLITNN